MHIITQVYRIDKTYSIFRENFLNNKRKWEITESLLETAVFDDDGYRMENKSEAQWQFYKVKSALKAKDDFIIETQIELLSNDQFGHYGILWGLDKECKVLNKFTVSADGERALMMRFDRNHKKIFFRSHCRNFKHSGRNKTIRMSLVKMGSFCYFCINNELLNIVNESHFVFNGPYVGFYTEPGISIKSKWLEIKKITARSMKPVSGLEMMLA